MNIRYTCRHCGKTNLLTSFWKWLVTPHFGARKRIKCWHCEKKSYMKRMDGREWLDWPKEKK